MTHEHESSSGLGSPSALKRTALFETHIALGARLVPFAGWYMPIQYSGILGEAKAVRLGAGIFDVSHMGRFEVVGVQAALLLHKLVTADVLTMPVGRARYTLICNEFGGIIDDTIVYRFGEERFLLVPNAANADAVLQWIYDWKHAWGIYAEIHVLTLETALIAIQGPRAEAILQPLCSIDLSSVRPFRCAEGRISGVEGVFCRTGYTGEDGFEIIIPSVSAPQIWLNLRDGGAIPCGLGARDVLRLEAGLLLHGSDMDSTVTPLEAGLGRFVVWDKGDFNGMTSLMEAENRGLSKILVGFCLLEKGIPRQGQPMRVGESQVGTVTSGTYSPALDTGLGLGYVPLEYSDPGTRIAIEIRGRQVGAEVVSIPFYSGGR